MDEPASRDTVPPTAPGTAAQWFPGDGASAALQAGVADRYQLEGQLGRGGTATVYLAQDRRHHRKVALKVLHPALAHALGSDRFLREIEMAASLTHPHIVPLFDSGATPKTGLLWYTMPYIEGESLRDRLNRESQLPVADAIRIAIEIADALAYAHQHGIIHRDIKPENILLTGSHALVADFGLAKAVVAAAGHGRITDSGMAVGTTAYMSPEQAAGERELDARSDIFSLGCVLYEMLAGEPPFTGPTPQVVIARRFIGTVKPIHNVRDVVPNWIEQVVHKALATAPDDRYATAEQFAQALTSHSALTQLRPAATPMTEDPPQPTMVDAGSAGRRWWQRLKDRMDGKP